MDLDSNEVVPVIKLEIGPVLEVKVEPSFEVDSEKLELGSMVKLRP